jgi:hypothetical protein
MAKEEPKLNAVDVLNWEYLVKIGEFLEPDHKPTPDEAIKGFAYSLVSTGSEEIRDTMLTSILLNATRWSSAEKNEELCRLACARSEKRPRFTSQLC